MRFVWKVCGDSEVGVLSLFSDGRLQITLPGGYKGIIAYPTHDEAQEKWDSFCEDYFAAVGNRIARNDLRNELISSMVFCTPDTFRVALY